MIRKFLSATQTFTLSTVLFGLAVLGGFTSSADAQSFVPDAVVAGDNLAGWTPRGGAWSIRSGEITALAAPGGSWLVGSSSMQDLAVSGRFRCQSECDVGVLLRSEIDAAGGMQGILVTLTPNGAGIIRVKVDPTGAVTERLPLSTAPSMLRIAPPPQPVGGVDRGGGRGTAPAGFELPLKAPDMRFKPLEWNSFEALLDANIARALLNDGQSLGAVVTDVNANGFGPVALFVQSDAPVKFEKLAFKDMAPKAMGKEELSPRFDIQRVDPFFYSWGVAVADFNRDGVPDVAAGPNYYLGPTYDVRREFTLSETYSPSTDSPVFQVELAADFTGDGWVDILDVSLNRPGKLYVNPRGQSRRWTMSEVLPRMGGELALLTDVDQDGEPEILAYLNGAIVLAQPGGDPTTAWDVRPISPVASWGQHGMGVGDINGDGRLDIVHPQGWFEQPVKGTVGPWTYHPQIFSRAGRTAIGGSRMGVYDVNGDGLADVVTALQAHNVGISWFEQRAVGNRISFVEHPIMKGVGEAGSAGNVVFSQPHGAAVGDIDGDKIPDFIVGKRHWSHHEGTTDPGTEGPAVLYVYRTVRNPRAPGGAEFMPELIHNRSGAGSQVEALDMNRDGLTDVVTTGDHGTFIFWNKGEAR